MAATGTPGDGAGILGGPWPQYNANESNRLLVGNFSGVGYINYTVCEFWDKIANSTIAASSAGPGQLLLPDVRIALGIAFLTTFQCFLCLNGMKSCHVNRKKLQGLGPLNPFEQATNFLSLIFL